jgi:hypothetical protein
MLLASVMSLVWETQPSRSVPVSANQRLPSGLATMLFGAARVFATIGNVADCVTAPVAG